MDVGSWIYSIAVLWILLNGDIGFAEISANSRCNMLVMLLSDNKLESIYNNWVAL